MYKRAVVGIVVLVTIGLVIGIRLLATGAIADAEKGLSPFTALELNDGRNVGVLAPGQSRWYEFASNPDGGFQRQADLTLFFTPDDGGRSHHVHFRIFPADQIETWYLSDAGQMQNLGAGGVVSRDGNPVTGELLWSGWLANDSAYYVEVFNGADITIDYWLFTGDIVAAELGPGPDPAADAQESAEANSNPVPAPSHAVDAPAELEAEDLLPVASDSQGDQSGQQPEIWDVPAGTPTHLIIPAIGLESSIASVNQTAVIIDGKTYGQWETADDRVGWHNLSAKLGQAGNTVLNGHSDVNAAVFRNLRFVEVGDRITVFSGNQNHDYFVTHKFLVEERGVSLQQRIQNAAWIASTQDERLTLVTCANPGASHRLIVIARP